MRVETLHAPHGIEPEKLYHLCAQCGQPVRPKGVKKVPNEYDHAQGCQYARESGGV
jgi:hypothetical protein